MKGYHHGDFTVISEIFNSRNKETITPSYVRMVVNGLRDSNSETANEIADIARTYFNKREQLTQELITSTL